MPCKKGYSVAGSWRNKERAEKQAAFLKPKFFNVEVKKGVHTYGGGVGVKPKKQEVWRVWVK